jgi:ankyrin repeat protein
LHWASQQGYLSIVALLLDRGADVMASNQDGRTALHLACICERESVVRFLLQRGTDADAGIGGTNGHTPLHDAVFVRHDVIIRLLLAHGANINALDKYGSSPLHRVTYSNGTDTVRILLDAGANVNAVASSGDTALRNAVWCSSEAVALLLDRGADASGATPTGWRATTPLHVACAIMDVGIVRLLVTRGARVNTQDTCDGKTPLHTVLTDREYVPDGEGALEIVQILVEHGADVNVRDDCGVRQVPARKQWRDPQGGLQCDSANERAAPKHVLVLRASLKSRGTACHAPPPTEPQGPRVTPRRVADGPTRTAHRTAPISFQPPSPKASYSSPHRETLFALSGGFLSACVGADRRATR